MKYIPAKVTTRVAREVLRVRKNSPVLMFSAGMVGAVTATVLACRATLKVEEVIAEAEKDRAKMDEATVRFPEKYTEENRAEDDRYLKVKIAVSIAKLYAPAIGVGVVSVGLLTGAHVVLSKRNAGLTAAYVALDRGFREYRARVVGELGEDKDREFLYGVTEKEIVEEGEHGHEVKTIKRNGLVKGKSIYAKLYDESNKHWSPHPWDNKTFIQVQQSWLNDKLRANGYVMLNDAYEALGLDKTSAGAVVGWVRNTRTGDGYIDFGLDDKSDAAISDFMINRDNNGVWLDFNVDGPVFELIDEIERQYKQ